MIRVKRLIHRQKAAEIVGGIVKPAREGYPARISSELLSISIFIASTSAKVYVSLSLSLGILVANLQTDNLELPLVNLGDKGEEGYENFSFLPFPLGRGDPRWRV